MTLLALLRVDMSMRPSIRVAFRAIDEISLRMCVVSRDVEWAMRRDAWVQCEMAERARLPRRTANDRDALHAITQMRKTSAAPNISPSP